MEFRMNHMTANEARKAALLIIKAEEIEMNLGGYGELAVNQSSGNVYLWLEDYPFTLYIAPSGGDRIWACWTNPINGEEEFTDTHDLTLHDLEEWAEELASKTEEEA